MESSAENPADKLSDQTRQLERYQRMSETAKLGGWEYDIQTKSVWWSDLTCDIHEVPRGYTPTLEEAINFYYSEDDKKAIERAVRKAAEDGSHYDLELRIRTARNKIRWIRTMGQVEKRDTTPVRAIGTIQDITKEIVLRRQLKRERDFNESLLSHLNSGFTAFTSDGTQVKVNCAFCEMTGFTREELIGHGPPYPYWHPDHYGEAREAMKKILTGAGSPTELALQKKSGELIWVEAFPSFLVDSQTGETFYYAIITDISVRREIESALRASENRFREILRRVPTVAVQGYAMDGTIRYWNHASTLLYGYTEEEVLGKNLLDIFIPNEDKNEVVKNIAKMAQTGEPLPAGEIRMVCKDGSIVTVLSSHSIVDVPGYPLEFYCIDVDLTQRRQMEDVLRAMKVQAEIANQAKSEFLTNMSHEIRTPLNGVIGMAQLLLMTSLTEEQKNYVEILQGSGEDLLKLITDLLDFSKIEAGKLNLETSAFNPHDLLEGAANMFRTLAGMKQLSFELKKDPDLPETILGDGMRIRQILNNLLSNAIKFTDEGRISLEVYVYHNAQGQKQIHYAVHDTGIGIDAEAQLRLFGRFVQIDGSISRSHGGTGLGLAISRQLARLMGGDITVSSKPGRGSVFTFSLPINPSPANLATSGGVESG